LTSDPKYTDLSTVSNLKCSRWICGYRREGVTWEGEKCVMKSSFE